MTMQSSGPISIGQARNECGLGNPINAGNGTISKLAGVGSGSRYAWSYWYGKSNGFAIREQGTQYYNQNYSGSCSANFGRNLYVYRGGFVQTGGDNTVTGSFPGAINGRAVAGFFRYGNYTTVYVANTPGDGLHFTSSLGDNAYLSNDVSYSWTAGPNLWTAYGITPGVAQSGAVRNYTINLDGNANRPQPPAGYTNGVAPPPPSSGDTGSSSGGGGCCFIRGSVVLMADKTWKPVEQIVPGDILQGPKDVGVVKRLHVARLDSYRRMMTMAEDPSLMWSEEHPFWAEQNGKQWWWSAGVKHLLAEMESGLVRGLKDPSSVLEGKVKFAHLQGFVDRTPVPVDGMHPDTLVYIPVVEGSPCIINGYVVSAFINEYDYDYTQLDWREHYSGLIDVRSSLDEVLAPFFEYA